MSLSMVFKARIFMKDVDSKISSRKFPLPGADKFKI